MTQISFNICHKLRKENNSSSKNDILPLDMEMNRTKRKKEKK
jgi:hypothetical protein